jgi:hypothetical protein
MPAEVGTLRCRDRRPHADPIADVRPPAPQTRPSSTQRSNLHGYLHTEHSHDAYCFFPPIDFKA